MVPCFRYGEEGDSLFPKLGGRMPGLAFPSVSSKLHRTPPLGGEDNWHSGREAE